MEPMERPLDGMRVLLTRPRERSEELAFLLEDEGAEVISLPLLELQPPDDLRPLQAAVEAIHRYRWVLFASPSGVQAFYEAARVAGVLGSLGKLRYGAVGERTAQVAIALGLKVEVTPPMATGAELAAAMKGRFQPGDDLLLPAAQEGRRELEEALTDLGAQVSRVAAYRAAPSEVDETLRRELVTAPPDVALFGSPRTVHAFLEAFGVEARGLLEQTKRVAIGPTTAAALEAQGLAAHAVAAAPTPEGLVQATVAAVRSAASPSV